MAHPKEIIPRGCYSTRGDLGERNSHPIHYMRTTSPPVPLPFVPHAQGGTSTTTSDYIPKLAKWADGAWVIDHHSPTKPPSQSKHVRSRRGRTATAGTASPGHYNSLQRKPSPCHGYAPPLRVYLTMFNQIIASEEKSPSPCFQGQPRPEGSSPVYLPRGRPHRSGSGTRST